MAQREVDQRLLRWLGHMERMNEYLIAKSLSIAKVSGGQVRGRPMLGWMSSVLPKYYF